MNLRALRKRVTSNIIKILIILNVICFISLSLQGLFTWTIFHRPGHTRLDSLFLQYDRIPGTASAEGSSMNKLAWKKIEQMKRELNYSDYNDQSLFPGNRIGRYILNNPHLCRSVNKVDIIIIVHTAPKNLDRRQRIRDSFAKASLFRPFIVRAAFLLGITSNTTLERILWMEHARYNDTIMGNFNDDYHNLTLKGVMGFRWVSQYCSNSNFVLKIDDDILVNMFKLLYSFLNHMAGKKKSIFCNLWHSGTMGILRDGKWKVQHNVFSSRKTFPYDYCSGFLVIMTTDLMKPMYEAALTTPFFWIDDVYLFGMLPLVVGDVTYYDYGLNKNLTLNVEKAKNCTRSFGPRCPIFATSARDKDFWSYWRIIEGLYTSDNWAAENKLVH